MAAVKHETNEPPLANPSSPTGDLPPSCRLSDLVRPRPTKVAGHPRRIDCRHNIDSPLLPNKHTSTRLCESCDTLGRIERP